MAFIRGAKRMIKVRRKKIPVPIRRRRVRRSLPLAQLKSYNYTFQPNDQWIASTANSTPGDIGVVPLAPPLSTASILAPIPAQSGFNFYYDMGIAMTFKAQDIGNFVKFAGVYSEYKINSIQVKMTYLTTDATISGAALLPTLNYVMDTNNASSAPTALQDVQGKAGSRTLRVASQRNVLTLNIKPYQRLSSANNPPASVDVPSRVVRAGWNSCENQNVTHYAGKFWFQNMYLPVTSSTNTAIQFEYKYNVSFRGAQNLY